MRTPTVIVHAAIGGEPREPQRTQSEPLDLCAPNARHRSRLRDLVPALDRVQRVGEQYTAAPVNRCDDVARLGPFVSLHLTCMLNATIPPMACDDGALPLMPADPK